MKDIRAQAAKSLGRVIGQGESFSGDIDFLGLPKKSLSSTQATANDSKNSNDKSTDKNDRGFYRELCFGTLRFYHRLDALLQPLLKKPFSKKDADIHALLLIGLYQLVYLRTPDHAAISASVDATKALKKPWAKGLVNAVLRNFLRQQNNDETKTKALKAAAQASHPQWLLEKLKQDWPDHWQAVVDYNNSQPAMALRVNLGKVSRDDYQARLRELDIETECDPNNSCGLRLNKATAVTLLPEFEQGVVSVQDPGAQLAAELLNLEPAMRVLDACAAPGGKTTHILEIAPDSLLTAIDSSSERLQKVIENLARHHAGRVIDANTQTSNKEIGGLVKCLHADSNDSSSWWDGKLFDRILLDAPCSGTGIISHHPDIKLLRRPSDLKQFAAQQKQLLNTLWPLLAEGGQLLYCTCSIMPEENSRIIETFIEQTASAKISPISAQWGEACEMGRQLLPNQGKNGGFFYARLSKSATL